MEAQFLYDRVVDDRVEAEDPNGVSNDFFCAPASLNATALVASIAVNSV